MLHQDDPVRHRRPLSAAQVYRLPGERPQTRLVEEGGKVLVDVVGSGRVWNAVEVGATYRQLAGGARPPAAGDGRRSRGGREGRGRRGPGSRRSRTSAVAVRRRRTAAAAGSLVDLSLIHI